MRISVVEILNAYRRQQEASGREDGKQRRPVEARVWKAGGVHSKLWHVRRDADKNLGSPIYCLMRFYET
jgi:hypothetical protein